MPIHSIARRSTVNGTATPSNAPIYLDSDDNIIKVIPAGSGTTEVQVIDASSTQTLTNKTLTSPTITGATGTINVAALAALGTNQATAAPIVTASPAFIVVSAADDTVGVLLPVATAGKIVYIKSTVSNKILKVYPNTGAAINAIAGDTAISLASGPTPAVFIASSATQWYTIPLLPS